MKLVFLALFLISLLTSALARPQYKDIDYKLYNDNDDGVAVDAVYEILTDKPPDASESSTAKSHHHHHHHKKMIKTNRLDRLKRYLRDLNDRL